MEEQITPQYMEAAMRTICPSAAAWNDFRAGRLTAAMRSQMESHAGSCQDCESLLRDLADFFEDDRPGEQLGMVDTDAEFAGLWQRLAPAPVSVVPTFSFWDSFRIPAFRAVWGVAACALLVAALTGGFAWTGLMQQKAYQAQLRQQDQALARQSAELTSLRALVQPRVGAVIRELYPVGTAVRSTGAPTATEPEVPRDAPATVLLYPNPGSRFQQYQVEIVESGGNVVFSDMGPRPADGPVNVSIPPGALKPGAYDVKLSDAGDTKAPVATYRIKYGN
jgi:hypothetical protein